MALRLSLGLIIGQASSGSFKAVLEGASGFLIDIYSGTRPADPNDPPSGTRLVTVSVNGGGGGLHFTHATLTDNTLAKSPDEVWSGVIANAGTGTWYRLYRAEDPQGSSTTYPRIDGTVGTSGADMTLTSSNFVAGAPFLMNDYSIEFPRGL